MATRIHVEGYVNSIKTFDWGRTLSVSVNNRTKNAAGEWETSSRDYYDVVVPTEVSLDGIVEDLEVEVEGTFKTGKTFQKRDGSTGVELKVRATSVKPLERKPKAETEDEAPF